MRALSGSYSGVVGLPLYETVALLQGAGYRSTRTGSTPPRSCRERRAAAECPICGKAADKAYRPFCSKRCADVDLNRWLGGQYAIPPASSRFRGRRGSAGLRPRTSAATLLGLRGDSRGGTGGWECGSDLRASVRQSD